nr:MAG TPA: hypothetical protein [Caudoviricetes sp.]
MGIGLRLTLTKWQLALQLGNELVLLEFKN